MNGASSGWRAVKTKEGGTYYHNEITKETKWGKPIELMTPAQRASGWVEYYSGSRPYWSHSGTKETTWERPDAYKETQSQPPQPPPQTYVAGPASFVAGPTAFAAGGRSSYHPPYNQHDRERDRDRDRDRERDRDRDRDDYDRGADRRYGYTADGPRGGGLNSDDPEYATAQEAEAAFFKVLKKAGVQVDWTYEKAMKAAVRDPQYRALRTPRERKAAFAKYVVEVRAQEKEREKERMAKLRADFTSMLKSHPEIKHTTRYKTALPIIEGETIFNSAKDDQERRVLFYDYTAQLHREHMENEERKRRDAIGELPAIFDSLNLDRSTPWNDAKQRIAQSHHIVHGPKFGAVKKSDMINAFKKHVMALENSYNDARKKRKNKEVREQRQNRDRFIGLLDELRANAEIVAGTKWKDIYPLIADDPRYTAIVGQEGSSVVDLFHDAVDEAEVALRAERNMIVEVTHDRRFGISAETSLDEFLSEMQTDQRTAMIGRAFLEHHFAYLREKEVRRRDRMFDELRSKMRHLEPPIRVTDTWEQVRPRVNGFKEYLALGEGMSRRAYEKAIQRLKQREKEKEDDRGHERSRGGTRGHGRERERERDREHDRERDRDRGRERDRDRDRVRDRGRDRRNGHDPGSLDPAEMDIYEADRKKAQADRERQYRKSGGSGLSPTRRDGIDSYVPGRDRPGRPPASFDYDEPPRALARETKRERSYGLSRADPREDAPELDYGESRPTNVRRRRSSEASSTRAAKRVRRSIEKPISDPAPAPTAQKAEEEPALRSGSEEGEIEED